MLNPAAPFDTTGAPFIRLRATPLAKRSLFLSDLDNQNNRNNQRSKVPCYVPAGGAALDIPYVDRVQTSYLTGSIRGFLQAGLLTAEILEASTVTQGVTAPLASSAFYRVSTAAGPVTLTLPWPVPEGTWIRFQKNSFDANAATIVENPAGGVLEGGPRTLLTPDAVLPLYYAGGVWKVYTGVSTPVPPPPSSDMTLVGPLTVNYGADYQQTIMMFPQDNTGLIVTLPEPGDRPGGLLEVVKFNDTLFPVRVQDSSGDVVALLVAPRETASFRSLGISWARIS
jgi:hypothetical protein